MTYCWLCQVVILLLCCCAFIQAKLHIGIPEGTAANDNEDVDTSKILVQQIRAYWRCYETVRTRPLSDAGGDKKNGNDLFCPATFDGWGCWDATSAGEMAEIPCPSEGNSSRKVKKRCSENGYWEINADTKEEKVDYRECNINVSTGDADLLFQVIEELVNLERSPYSDPQTAEAFEICLETVLSAPKISINAELYCPRTFDGWGCWNDTLAGKTAYIPCPRFITGFLPERSAHKECNPDGSWYRHPDTNRTWSNYTTCVDKDDLTFRQRIVNIYISGYSTSVIALLISLGIFFYFRCVQCTRITIHKHLFMSFIINNIMWIIWYTEVVQKPSVLISNELPCQILHVLVHYFLVSNYLWMFCEGLYLHTLLIVAFVAEDKLLKWFYLIGWGIPLVIITVYASVRSSFPKDTEFCWIEESNYSWIISGPVCISMLLNFVFLVNIVRVLVTKLRAVNSPDTHQTRKAVRATLILIPLLGLHYVVTPFRPVPRSPGEAIYETVSAIVTSFQGLMVALLFCFFNGEVIALVRKKWNQALLMRGRRMSYAATTVSFNANPVPMGHYGNNGCITKHGGKRLHEPVQTKSL
ncbi:calcitonin gene-related peptide type 1 receptor-like isoform X1 [Argiope bruennichi]|uniref:calcitonin gene-related peptide type 1 receptor-like isoform X1 n=1 Tax=Argiope bruennichi TaxID=94029 RepID=UPI0024946B65|nr:calcitonin gene-related peptide type 1 receptor-like isoform X1 [Argiope bruennichi]XP_055936412.1 calcitonin gene-related peptide type 1 receptor-like isoform X1 [Argiope bruennichi]XP_055936413.1 calcitonin gene-related peptide type 1 receptor-like isoform X1 [Argiope bruennichi]